jgi:hypothetical protein
MAFNLFKLKLLESGYYDIHRPFYEDRGTRYVRKIFIGF